MIDQFPVPAINVNGTSKAELTQQYTKVLSTLNATKRALVEAEPHGRDYQTLEAGAFKLAAEAHRVRMQKLDDIRKEIKTILEAISD